MKNFFRRFFKKAETESTSRPMAIPLQAAAPLLKGIENTADVEYSCDDVYRLMDEYVELLRRGEDTSKLMPLVEHHLKMCADCREEIEALLRMMNGDISLYARFND